MLDTQTANANTFLQIEDNESNCKTGTTPSERGRNLKLKGEVKDNKISAGSHLITPEDEAVEHALQK